MKKTIFTLICFLLSLTLLFVAGCGERPQDTSSNSSDSSDGAIDERPRGEALTEEELPYEKYIYENNNDWEELKI